MKFLSSLTILFLCLISTQIEAQININEGLNMPGSYNTWTNPPTILNFRSVRNGGNLGKISTGTPRYQCTFSVAAAGADIVAGTYQFLFTSGGADPYANKWADATVVMNTIQNYNYYLVGGTDNSITVQNNKYYTMTWLDNGYANTSAIFMPTSARPVVIQWCSDNYKQPNQDVTVTVKIDVAKSPEERIFVRYTTDNWTTSAFSEAAGSGTVYTAIIPAAAVTATANNQYYSFTTTYANPTHANADLISINIDNNTYRNYSMFDKYLVMDVVNLESSNYGPLMFSYTPTVKNCNIYDCTVYPAYGSIYAYGAMGYNLNPTATGLSGCGCGSPSGFRSVTSSSSSSLQTNIASSTIGLTLNFGDAFLAGYISNCPNSDRRVYAGTSADIKLGGTKLKFTNYRMNLYVVYPHAPGPGISGDGYAQIDPANSDARWVAEFDPYNTGQVQVDVQSFSAIVQGCYGYYNVTYKIKPSTITYHQGTGSLSSQGNPINETFNLPDSRVSINFTAATYGLNANGNKVYVNQILSTPGGSLPGGIDAKGTCYWDIAYTLATFTSHITFDIADAGNVAVPANLRILRRDNSTSAWAIWTDYTLVDPTHIRANNVSTFGEWVIGSTGGNVLPVELTSFSAAIINNHITLKWNTATEITSSAFEIERKNDANCESWTKVGSVKASGNSNSPKSYIYIDQVNSAGRYQYRLKQIDTDGKFDYSSPVSVNMDKPIRYDLSQNYPNPFNPTTTITYTVPQKTKVVIEIFDVLGSKIESLVNDEKEAGIYSVEFNANNFASGTYFYKITAGTFVATKKMNLIK